MFNPQWNCVSIIVHYNLFIYIIYISDIIEDKLSLCPVDVEVWRVHFWMRLLGSKYPKRSVIYSSSPKVWRFKTGHLRMGRRKSKGLLVKHYRDSTGRARFVGKKVNLKHSANLGWKMVLLFLYMKLETWWFPGVFLTWKGSAMHPNKHKKNINYPSCVLGNMEDVAPLQQHIDRSQ